MLVQLEHLQTTIYLALNGAERLVGDGNVLAPRHVRCGGSDKQQGQARDNSTEPRVVSHGTPPDTIGGNLESSDADGTKNPLSHRTTPTEEGHLDLFPQRRSGAWRFTTSIEQAGDFKIK